MAKSRASSAKRFLDWLGLRLARSSYVDGLWVGTYHWEREAEILGQLCEALLLIKTYDAYRYKRVHKEVDRIWAYMLPAATAEWDFKSKTCVVDPRFILSSPIELIASAIIHEATHGRLMRLGISYREKLRYRVEGICMRQELAFARKLPDAESLRQDIEQQLTLVPNNWTDGALRRNREEGEFELAHQLNVPEWLVKVAHTVRKNRRIRE